jgi:integrase
MRGLGRIFKRGDTFWISYYHRGREYRESAHTTSETKAERYLKKKWQDLGKGKQPGTSEEHVTVEELLNDLETDHTIRRLASLPALRSQASAILEACGAEQCEHALDVTTARVRRIMASWQKDGVADATINRRVAYLRRAFRLAREAEPPKVTTVPVFPKLAEHNARQGFFDKGTFLAVRAVLPDDGLRDFVEWAYWTGMRKGEIAALTWDAFDRDLDHASAREGHEEPPPTPARPCPRAPRDRRAPPRGSPLRLPADLPSGRPARPGISQELADGVQGGGRAGPVVPRSPPHWRAQPRPRWRGAFDRDEDQRPPHRERLRTLQYWRR